MKQHKIFAVLFSLFGLLVAGCDDNMPVVEEIGVESVTLSDDLRDGITMVVNTSINIAGNITLFPENATDRAESFSSSNVDVATVNQRGELVANDEGTSEITISAGGKSAAFTLSVVDKIIIPATEIELARTELDMMVGDEYNLSAQVIVTPLEANDGISYTSSAPGVVSVNEEGLLTGVSAGGATITVASKQNPTTVKATLPVTVTPFSGDYPRSSWEMTASHQLFKSTNDVEKNSLAGAFDEDFTTNFCLVRPGKGFGNVPKVDVPSGEAIYFVVDMQKPREVNYFRIRHRDVSQVFIRWHAFDEISGSNDGETFTPIATNVAVTNVGTASAQVSPNIAIPKSTYRYLKFYAQSAACFYQSSYTSQGSSVQIQEFYIGLTP
jgi:hypothetical protein